MMHMVFVEKNSVVFLLVLEKKITIANSNLVNFCHCTNVLLVLDTCAVAGSTFTHCCFLCPPADDQVFSVLPHLPG